VCNAPQPKKQMEKEIRIEIINTIMDHVDEMFSLYEEACGLKASFAVTALFHGKDADSETKIKNKMEQIEQIKERIRNAIESYTSVVMEYKELNRH
jgi:hypothetical protein